MEKYFFDRVSAVTHYGVSTGAVPAAARIVREDGIVYETLILELDAEGEPLSWDPVYTRSHTTYDAAVAYHTAAVDALRAGRAPRVVWPAAGFPRP